MRRCLAAVDSAISQARADTLSVHVSLITVFRPCLQLRFDWSVFAVDELHVELPGLRDLYVSKSLLARVVKA